MSDVKLPVAVGDWVRFYRGGVLVIGQVEYELITLTGDREFCTDCGVVKHSSILEKRVSRE